MKEMMAEMNGRLSLAEWKLAKTEAELAASKDALSKAIIDQAEAHAITKYDLAITQDNLAITKEALMSKNDELEKEVAILRAPPFIHACGSHPSAGSGTISYTSLLYSSTNTEGGGLDIDEGVFTAPWGGSYTVSWDTSAGLSSGERVKVFLQKNGENIEETVTESFYTGGSYVRDQGGRTLVVHLDLGETLQLYRDGGTGTTIDHITFCVSLTTF